MAVTKPIHVARSSSRIFALFITLMAITVHGVESAIIKCEELPVELCAFSVSSSGNRCVLEKDVIMNDTLQFECQSSLVMVEKLVGWIESEQCINACGLERMAVGMSTDSIHEPEFSTKFCSSECRNNCPNIVDLHVNLAAGEGISIASMCESQKSRSGNVIKKSETDLSKSKSSILSKSSESPNRKETIKLSRKLL